MSGRIRIEWNTSIPGPCCCCCWWWW